jgi:hypothetical protein
VRCRDKLATLISSNYHLQWIDRSKFSPAVGMGAFRLVPAFLATHGQEAVNALNDVLARKLFARSSVYRGVPTIDGDMCIAILTIPSVCLGTDDVASAISNMIMDVQAHIEYPGEVIELLSEVLQVPTIAAMIDCHSRPGWH